MTAPKLTLRALNRATLARQMLLAGRRPAARDAVERLVGLQAQWPRPPFIGLWSRIEGFQREELAGRSSAASCVRASMMRGTLHVVSAETTSLCAPQSSPCSRAG